MRVSWLFSLLLLGVSLSRGEIRIVGSDLLGPALPPALQDYARRNEMSLTVKLAGSYAGWEELQAGRADVALLSFAPGDPLPAAPYYSVPLAYHTAVVLVPAALPLEQISFEQLAEIFGATGQTGFRRWGELGLTGEWTARLITPHALGSRAGLARAIFRHEVLADGALRSGVPEQNSAKILIRQLAAEEGGIALVAVSPVDDKLVKVLPVARDAGAVAYGPTPESVHRGDYPLRWPVQLVFRRSEAPRLFGLLRHLLSEEVAADFAAAGLTPVPRETRNGQIFDLEQL